VHGYSSADSGVARKFDWEKPRFPSLIFRFSFRILSFFSIFLLFIPFALPSLPLFSSFSLPFSLRSKTPKIQLGSVGAYIFKRWDLVATILIIFPKMNWPKWQVQFKRMLSLSICFVLRIVGPGPHSPFFVYAIGCRNRACFERVSMHYPVHGKLLELRRSQPGLLKFTFSAA